jgi:hypothetical protein
VDGGWWIVVAAFSLAAASTFNDQRSTINHPRSTIHYRQSTIRNPQYGLEKQE